jgi:hypothetical protein
VAARRRDAAQNAKVLQLAKEVVGNLARTMVFSQVGGVLVLAPVNF